MIDLARLLVRYGYAPLMILGINGAAYLVVSRGYSYSLLVPLLVLAFATAFLSERLAPWYDEWNLPHGDDVTNMWHALVYELQNIYAVLMIPFFTWLFQIKPGTLIGLWPREWPIFSQWILAIVITDFGLMFLHLLSHRWPVLWRLHAVHHGVERLYGLNGLVRHPVHQIVDLVVVTGPLAFVGMPVNVSVLLGFAISVQLVVQHSNVAYELGPFRNHLAIGRIHHLHHVNWGKEGDCNFGLFLTLWDRLLGTFKPEPPRPISASDMGVDEVPNFPRGYVEQLVFPLRYIPGQGYRPRVAAVRKSHS
jgi:sterol desaturase/sphingolipid hydroxylase (fatty acid hydroxylase superfamily)